MIPRTPSRAGSRGKPDESRESILHAALEEFARVGIAGARIDAIAAASGLNKALIYYYFGDKEGLYGAALEHVISGLVQREMKVLEQDLPALEKLLLYATTHFDYIAERPAFPRILQGEMLRAGTGKSPHLRAISEKFFRPLYDSLLQTIETGIRRGEIRKIDPGNFIISMVGLVVFHFVSTPVTRAAGRRDPLSPEALRDRRAALLDHVTAILRPVQPTQRRGKQQ